MLTDRQEKIYQSISDLINKDITDTERINLERAKKSLDRGDDFRATINWLCLGLKSLESLRLQGELSSDVKILYDNLIKVYGEPVREEVKIIGPTVSLERGLSFSFVLGGVGAFIIILALVSTAYLSHIILTFGKTGTIALYLLVLVLAISLMLISNKKRSSGETGYVNR